jgi:uncharacterized protein (TIGR02246 family)
MRKKMQRTLLLVLLALVVKPALALPADTNVSEGDVMQAATELAQRYDADYAAKDSAAMAGLYTPDAVLIPTSGPVLHGREAIKTFYAGRFAAGAGDHAIKITEVHVQGNGGYSLAEFSATIPNSHGDLRTICGNIVSVYQRDSDGWHMRLSEPSAADRPGCGVRAGIQNGDGLKVGFAAASSRR